MLPVFAFLLLFVIPISFSCVRGDFALLSLLCCYLGSCRNDILSVIIYITDSFTGCISFTIGGLSVLIKVCFAHSLHGSTVPVLLLLLLFLLMSFVAHNFPFDIQ